VIRDDRRREKAGELETAVAIRRAHHGDLDTLVDKSGDTSCPFSFDRGPPFELKAELSKEINCPPEVLDDDSYVIHSFERHASTVQDGAWMQQRMPKVECKYRRRSSPLCNLVSNCSDFGVEVCYMAKLIYGLNQSLDGYVDHQKFVPRPALFRHFIEDVRGLSGMVYGRRMYEVMRY